MSRRFIAPNSLSVGAAPGHRIAQQLLAVGADPALETRIDDYTTALKEADNAGFEDGAS
ncbi:hypothetical protein X753_07235 [Mesorhizobium sp. LNJC399B00]|uniref:hypothetical protein n=1 Tax=unclassified Mesorhizobium TaxID=325217 RepID=UPI0003CF1313|nr:MULTISPECIES: hypothetical protein [unclassified Mesorhizobium]ESY08716.1 hypothetical protein X753_07235 [Mesorhizobium sp. LNJC399B00]WJI69628.1 hypothetical protein NLY36_02140 [Mesorhizobium sp. C399B]